jgi:DNA-binding response OmpR family regulator
MILCGKYHSLFAVQSSRNSKRKGFIKIDAVIKYLAVDGDEALAYSEACAWARRGIGMDHVDNMTDAIKKLMSDKYLYVGINGDATEFMPLLRTMSCVTDIPILIATNDCTTQKEVAALEHGADLYARWHKSSEDNMASVLAHVTRKSEVKVPTQKVFVHMDVLLSPFQRYVFVKNELLNLTQHEFDLFYYLMVNHGIRTNFQYVMACTDATYYIQRILLWQIILCLYPNNSTKMLHHAVRSI